MSGDLSMGSSVDSGGSGVDSSLYTPCDAIEPMVVELRASFAQGDATRSLEARRANIEGVLRIATEHAEELADAVHSDLQRHRTFTRKIIGGCVGAIQLALDNLESWSADRDSTAVNGATRCVVRPQPFGVALVIGTWNFPCPLVLKPLVSALAAGNCVVVKLNEMCGAVSTLMARLFAKHCSPNAVRIVQGGVPQSTALLKLRWGVIFYTGNTAVGRVVLRAAAEHITPCVVELGGKNPVVVAADADLANAARKIVDGRFKNAGQFCVAPDHVLCEGEAATALLLRHMHAAVIEYFTETPRDSPSYGRIINARHARRVADMLLAPHGGDIVCGGLPSDSAELEADIAARYIAPTIVSNPSLDSPLGMEEVFGPILPVFTVASVETAIEHIVSRPSPLALYVFSASDATVDAVVNGTCSGGVCVNDVILHMLNETLPFGGCGDSGMGAYHGLYGFDAFSHLRTVMTVENGKPAPAGRYPPFAP